MSTPRPLVARLIGGGADQRTVSASGSHGPKARARTSIPARLPTWAPLLVLVVACFVSLLRTSPTAASIVYAEDGRIFLGDQEDRGLAHSLLVPYTGYLQFLPRLLVAAARAAAPLEAYPLAIAVACAVVVGALTAMVFVWSGDVSSWLPFRLTIALITVLAPVAPIEVAGNVANIHWYALWAGFWLVLHRPRTRTEAVLLASIAATFALTEIQTALLLPIVLLRLRSPLDWIVRIGLLLGLGLQFAGLIHSPRTVISAHPPIGSIVAAWFLDVPTSVYAIPDATHGTWITSIGPAVGAAAVLPPLVALVYVLVRGTRTMRAAAAGLAVLSILVWFAAVWANTVDTGGPGFDVTSASPGEFVSVWYSRIAQVPSRYSLVPSMCLAALPVLAAAAWWTRTGAADVRTRWRAAVVPVLTVLVLGLSFVPSWSTRDGGPDWRTEVRAAQQQCSRSITTVTLRTAPAGWSVDLPCSVLR